MCVCTDRAKAALFALHLVGVVLVDSVFHPALSDGSHSPFPGSLVLLLLVLVKRDGLVSVLQRYHVVLTTVFENTLFPTGFEVLDLMEDTKSSYDICLKGHL